MSPRLFAVVLLTLLALIVVVALVSLARDNLDPVGLLTVLATMTSGIVVAYVTKGKPPEGGAS